MTNQDKYVNAYVEALEVAAADVPALVYGQSKVWDSVGAYRQAMEGCGAFVGRRSTQARAWMWNEVAETLMQALKDDPRVAELLPAMEQDVAGGTVAPGRAARQLVATFRHALVK